MRSRISHRILSCFFLLCLFAGQSIIYGHLHQHSTFSALHHTQKPRPFNTIRVRCPVCDLAVHSVIAIEHVNSPFILDSAVFYWKDILQHYKGIFLSHSDGLSPPLVYS
ncbi:hypothetical protein [Pedobacter sp. WC2423]|uniref:hypothetical protein n=1 Tax=Pedobacter sp. WC2423 TaxID=3234142 RepID=UPI0034675039